MLDACFLSAFRYDLLPVAFAPGLHLFDHVFEGRAVFGKPVFNRYESGIAHMPRAGGIDILYNNAGIGSEPLNLGRANAAHFSACGTGDANEHLCIFCRGASISKKQFVAWQKIIVYTFRRFLSGSCMATLRQ